MNNTVSANHSHAIKRVLPCLAGLTALILAGCGAGKRSEDGDAPPKLAEYNARVSPDVVSIVEPEASRTFRLDVKCIGVSLPPDCDLHPPNWFFEPDRRAPAAATALIADPLSPQTTATVIFDQEVIRNLPRPNGSGIDPQAPNEISLSFAFKPRNSPNGLKLEGSYYVSYTVHFKSPPPERQEQTPDRPRIGFIGLSGQRWEFGEADTYSRMTRKATIIYTGPPTTLTVSGPTDLGAPGGAAKFQLLSPSRIPVSGSASEAPQLEVAFRPDPLDLGAFSAGLFITAGNGKPVPIILSARK